MILTPDLASALNVANLLPQGDGTTSVARIPILMRCSSWVSQGLPPVRFAINPQNVSFSQGKRVSKKNTRGGTAFFHWTDRRGRNNDILQMNLRGVTGNIRNKPDAPSRGATGVAGVLAAGLKGIANALSGGPTTGGTPNMGLTKHITWARFYALTAEAMVDPTTQRPNVFEILYRSPLFPAPILFQGFFEKVLEFSEVAEQPWNISWSVPFTVQRSIPSIDVLSQYLSNALANPSQLEAIFADAAAQTELLEQAQQSVSARPFGQG